MVIKFCLGAQVFSVYISALIQNSSRNKAVSSLQPRPRLLAVAKDHGYVQDGPCGSCVVQNRQMELHSLPAQLPAPLPASFSEENSVVLTFRID